jgi:hypothetical protein
MKVDSRIVVFSRVDQDNLRAFLYRWHLVQAKKTGEHVGVDVEVVRREVPVAPFQAVAHHVKRCLDVMDLARRTDGGGRGDMSDAMLSKEESIIQNYVGRSTQKLNR